MILVTFSLDQEISGFVEICDQFLVAASPLSHVAYPGIYYHCQYLALGSAFFGLNALMSCGDNPLRTSFQVVGSWGLWSL
jgi:hypothetical protein